MNLKKMIFLISLVLLPLLSYADYSNYGKLSDISDSAPDDINWWPLIIIVGAFILAPIIGVIREIFGLNKDKD